MGRRIGWSAVYILRSEAASFDGFEEIAECLRGVWRGLEAVSLPLLR